jgi:hypothetical protein
MRSLTLAGALALFAGACSGDPAPVLLDAAPGVDADQLTRCLIPADYGALGTRTGTANQTTADSLTIVLDPGPPKDDFFLHLIAGQGAFAGGALKTGTFSLTGADTNLATCGLCTSLIADIVAGQGPSKFYFTDAGTVTLTSVNPIAGSAQNLHFVEITGAGAPVAGGCAATVASITFGS